MNILETLERDWAARRAQPHHQPYHATNITQEAPMTLALIDHIEQDLSAAGHAVDGALHDVLSRHLTIGNLAAHVGQYVQAAEASPLLQTIERYALGPAGEATVAKIVEDVAGLLQAQATPNMQAGGETAEPAPAQ